jgi:hypothetical protein
MGEHASDAAALTFIRANDWDTNKDGTGNPENGMQYYNTASHDMLVYRNGAWVSSAGVFGSQRDHDEDLTESTETGQTYQQQHRYTTASLPAGTYRVGWSLEFKGTNSARAVGLRVQQDDVTDLFENIEVELDTYRSFAHFHSLSLSGIHTFDFDIRRVAAQAVTATIRNIRIEIWRVA